MFSKHTTGYGLGEQIEKDTFISIPCGSLKGRGTVHFYDENEIVLMLDEIGFCDIQSDLVHYTDSGNVIEMILVQAKKRSKEDSYR